MGDIFILAKKFASMDLKEVAKLLQNNYYEVRMGAVSILDFKARKKKISEQEKKKLFDVYISNHKRINNWDLVDRAAPWVVGGYLQDKPRDILYRLARSKNTWEQRTAIVATACFIRQNDLEDTFHLAEILIHQTHDLTHKAVGSWIREAGKRDNMRLLDFLNKYAGTMPAVTLRYATEKLDQKLKNFYLKKRNQIL